ncbi:MAG TPA: response regulator, partial [Vicinamibacterales bacterium]
AVPATPPAHDASHRGTETILLVDDFARLREKMAESLRHLGYEVLQAGTGEEALRLWGAHRSRIGLLFTDISLPGGMNGFEIADALCASAPSLRVIFSSGYGDEMMDERRQADGMVFLPKPCDLGVMARTIRECFDKV